MDKLVERVCPPGRFFMCVMNQAFLCFCFNWFYCYLVNYGYLCIREILVVT